ncbi:transcriptional regulator ATRX-like protein [Senna tora]|uniref:U5 small nuclear ribonucleoprotein TSSC4 n=1 Tax=Senna tora TaxID=362788 RepID=A0A834SEH6_9FABA|nr:transcriptional regulator ATRX-like protein [Senna tora]
MEDSFRVRVDKAFGSLATAASSLSSLWSLTDDEIHPEPEPEPFPSFFDDRPRGPGISPSTFRNELEKDLEDLDEDEDDEPRSRGPSKPDDYDDEQWEIKSSIGRDCTLDFEEEEDQYDKQAVGKENSGDRLYMKDINDDGVEIDSCNVIPTSFREFVRDPRANHLAAKIRLEEDAEAAKKIDALQVSEKSAPVSDNPLGNTSQDGVNPKSILKRKDNPSEFKSQKRVRFDSECDDRSNDESEETSDLLMKTSPMEDITASNKSSRTLEFATAVPDYIRNPTRYTHYTFDSSGDVDDNSNKQAYMDFLSQLKRSKTATESQSDDSLDDLPAVTFISKKKIGDATMVDTDALSKQNIDVGKDLMQKRGLPISIAAGDNDVCAMEEDEPEVRDDTKRSSQRSNRHYRKKAQELDETIV